MPARFANYLYRSQVDSGILQTTPLEHKRALEELNRTQPIVSLNPKASVDAEDGNADQYLDKVDETIRELDEKEEKRGDSFTVADRVLRWHCLFSAALICRQYKCLPIQGEFAHLGAGGMESISTRGLKLSREMLKEHSRVGRPSYPDRSAPGHNPSMSTSPRTYPPRVPGGPASTDMDTEAESDSNVEVDTDPDVDSAPVQTRLSSEAIEYLLEKPADLLKMTFLCLSKDEDEAGRWSVKSIVHSRRGVEFVIVYDDCDGPIPMDRESMRWLMKESVSL
ncbi:uncharacterized protein BXZ73DRAFT_105397 [Epithele typhae]|uniref:uncharacterized protein n=1 Tax=Epithele typhae TaxID=378194 RepID=UPI00200850B1|nr:uncharacterized protein BXZ73DRAFT_105397 [Epithele typhae]KAH9917874.1 hypothetical protein BXZ73DRAFT_105397 [Epithele typhae]